MFFRFQQLPSAQLWSGRGALAVLLDEPEQANGARSFPIGHVKKQKTY